MLNTRLFGFWDHLGTALRTGKPQNEAKLHGKPVFEELYAEEARLGTFLDAMSGIQAGNFHALAERFDFSRYDTVTDAGGALALLSRILADKHPHLTFTSFDLPPVEPLARRHVKKADLGDRITVVAGDFLEDELPPADVVTMGNILHDWDLETKKLLIGKAFAARKAVPSSPSKTSSTTRAGRTPSASSCRSTCSSSSATRASITWGPTSGSGAARQGSPASS